MSSRITHGSSKGRLQATLGIVLVLLIHAGIAAGLGVWLFAADSLPAPASSKSLKPAAEDLAAMRQENEQLRSEIELLRRENQQLRRLMSDRSHAPTNLVSATGISTNALAADAPTHWLTTGGKRHNRECRYFQKAGGSACGPHDGTACKLCGG